MVNKMIDGGYFRMDEQIADTLDNHRYRAIRLEKGEIEFISRPKVGSDGTSQTIRMVLEVREFFVERKLHPLEPVDNRPRLHKCGGGDNNPCQYRQTDGGCTFNQSVHGGEVCKFEESDYDF